MPVRFSRLVSIGTIAASLAVVGSLQSASAYSHGGGQAQHELHVHVAPAAGSQILYDATGDFSAIRVEVTRVSDGSPAVRAKVTISDAVADGRKPVVATGYTDANGVAVIDPARLQTFAVWPETKPNQGLRKTLQVGVVEWFPAAEAPADASCQGGTCWYDGVGTAYAYFSPIPVA